MPITDMQPAGKDYEERAVILQSLHCLLHKNFGDSQTKFKACNAPFEVKADNYKKEF